MQDKRGKKQQKRWERKEEKRNLQTYSYTTTILTADYRDRLRGEGCLALPDDHLIMRHGNINGNVSAHKSKFTHTHTQ
jgi:hypothetical protein